MSRRPVVTSIRDSFLLSIKRAESLASVVQRLSAIKTKPGQPKLHPEHVGRVIELAFMGATASWEEFLEHTFIRYMAGAEWKPGLAPSLRLGRCRSLEHSYQVLTGDPTHDPEKQFIKWTDPDYVVGLAKVFFEQGRPYAASIGRFATELRYSVDVRNRVAHVSHRAKSRFRVAANYFRAGRPLSQGFRVSDLLMEVPRQGFQGLSLQIPGLMPKLFSAYMQMYQALAVEIVPL